MSGKRKLLRALGLLKEGAGSTEGSLIIRTKVLQSIDPSKWSEHRYGLTAERVALLDGKAFWVTGAGTGMGRALSCALAAFGARVILTGRRREKLEESIEEIASYDINTSECFMVEADITVQEQVQRACEEVKGACASLYGLVNNAAISTTKGTRSLENGSMEAWNQMMAINVTAPWNLTRMVFEHMTIGDDARVLFIGSEAGWANNTPGNGMYKVSKAALNGLSRAMASELAETYPNRDIQINLLVPGQARTEMNRGSTRSPYDIVSMALMLLTNSVGGPNGRFFSWDGRHLQFGNTLPYEKSLI